MNKVFIREPKIEHGDADVLKNDHVDIVAYNPEWPGITNIEIIKLREMLPSSKIIDIQHVGSTAIPGLAAKPIVDIQIAVNSLEEMKLCWVSQKSAQPNLRNF